MKNEKVSPQPDPWHGLKRFTAARIALGRTGTAEPLQAMLQFRMAHAHARDAVYATLQQDALQSSLATLSLPVVWLKSRAADRAVYLQRPDLGRQLDERSVQELKDFNSPGYDVCITLADGLSATAINRHAWPVVKELVSAINKAGLTIAPLCITEQGRVAIGDETCFWLKARLVIVLIGERPGLSSPDSMGAYITYQPKPGITDESRNCISNIRPEGLNYDMAVQKILFLAREALRLQVTGISLKDNSQSPGLTAPV